MIFIVHFNKFPVEKVWPYAHFLFCTVMLAYPLIPADNLMLCYPLSGELKQYVHNPHK